MGPTMGESDSRGRLLRDAVAPYAAGEQATFVKLSISLPADTVEVVRAAAAESGMSVSATIAAALRRTLGDAEQARLDAALEADREENLAWARAYEPIAAELLSKLEW
jgi:ribbon-helix-helix CopG family protein